MGLGAPHVSAEDMRNFNLCCAIVDGAICIQDGILQAALISADTQNKIASENRKADYANTKMMVEAILSGSSYVEQGLHQIASELKYANILTERRDLETKARSIEDWLFERGFLKDFYQTTVLSEKIIPFVQGSYFYFLNQVYQVDRGIAARDMQKKDLIKEEIAEITKNAQRNLCEFSLNMMCHPLITLAYLLSKNDLLYSSVGFRIGGTAYEWEVDWTACKCQRQDDEAIYDFGEYKIVFKKLHTSDFFHAKLTFEEALCHLIHVAKYYEEKPHIEELAVMLEWDAFFSELNMRIAMYNLRMLTQSLESFKRQKQLELLP